MQTLIAPLINLLILIAVLVYFLKHPVKEYAKNRSLSIREELKTAQENLALAKQRHAEFSSKLKAMTAEIEGLRAQALQDASEMKARVLADAQRMSANIVADAKNSAVTLYSEFKSQMYSELGNRVLERAESILRERLTGDDRARIAREFTSQVGAAQ